ncbi:MAG: iron uptake porin [Cyanophyceae cyanobacterium]
MVKLLCNSLKVGSAILGTALLLSGGSVAAQSLSDGSNEADVLQQIDQYSEGMNEDGSMGQVTNVEQLRDVSPGDWAFEALRSLVERYGCIEGYPDQTYRGNRALTRYEFAAGLNSCLNAIERLIASSGTGLAPEDLERLQRLAQEFEAELATLGARVDNLEGRVAFLEDNQFSTTTRLNAEAIFSLGAAFGGDRATEFDVEVTPPGTGDNDGDNVEITRTPIDDDDNDLDSIVTLSDRIRLNLDSSFTGEDLLRIRLQARNIEDFDTGTGMTTINYSGNDENDVEVSDLFYNFPVGERLQFTVALNDVTFDDIADPLSPFFSSSGSGALSFAGSYNALVYPSADAGLIANFAFTDNISVDVGYLAGNANDPTSENGLFNGDYAASAQLNLGFGDALDFALTYTRTYQPQGEVSLTEGLGSVLGDDPFFGESGVTANRYGATASFQLGERLNLGGWFTYIDAEAQSGFREDDSADIFTAFATVALLDLGREGSVLGFTGGWLPKATDVEGGPDDEDNSFLVEAQYRFPINDNILITPGAYVVFNPEHDEDNDNIWVGLIRTTFSF